MNKSNIEWCDYTWNPVTGCLHGCKYCYAAKIAKRFKPKNLNAEDLEGCFSSDYTGISFPHGFAPTFYFNRLNDPQKIKKPSKIFVCSMADLFGNWVPDEWIYKVLDTIEKCPQHTFMLLTKNPHRYCDVSLYQRMAELGNVMIGVTDTGTMKDSKGNPFYIKMPQKAPIYENHPKMFLSVEPLLGELDLMKIDCFDWVIIGAQTGPKSVPPQTKWVHSIIDKCRELKIPVFLKSSLCKALLLNDTEIIQEWYKGGQV